MKKITLLMPHEMNGIVHPEGATIEVEESVYDFLQAAYKEMREAPIRAQKAREAEEQLQKMMAKHGRAK